MNMKKILIASLLAIMVLTLAGCSSNKSAEGGHVFEYGAQEYTDPKIMGQIVKQLVEDRTIHEVNITEDIPASPQVIASLDRKDFDIATLYSGEVYNNHFDEDKVEYSTDPQKTIDQAQDLFREKYNLKWYDSIGFNNQYGIAITKDFAEKNKISTMTGLEKYADKLTLGSDITWIERANDGYKNYKKTYGYEFGETKGMALALMYKGIANGDLDVVTAYTVDPQILDYDLKLLKDDKEFFAPYDASLVARNEVLEKYPEIGEVLDSIVGLISTDEMTILMREVNTKGRSTEEVAKEFLQNKNAIK
jgi:osmoprotectant transport system substrate-binding protein